MTPLPRPSIRRHAAGVAFALIIVIALIGSLCLIATPKPVNPPTRAVLVDP